MRTCLIRAVLALAVMFAVCAPAAAQSVIRGKVIDGAGQPIEGATITVVATAAATRRGETKTNRDGEFVQIGMTSGQYTVTAVKDTMKLALTANVTQDRNRPVVLTFQLTPVSGLTPEQIKDAQLVQGAMEALKAGRDDEAIEKFNEIAAKMPTCGECYYHIGTVHLKKQQFAEAETAFKKAIEIAPTSGDAYTQLASLYNSQKKFDLAQEASAKAAELSGGAGGGGGSAEAVYNQGVILFNGQKYAEAKVQFEAAVKADPTMAPAQLQLGLSSLNLGLLPDAAAAFEAYLALDPDGAKLPANSPLKIADLNAFVASQKK